MGELVSYLPESSLRINLHSALIDYAFWNHKYCKLHIFSSMISNSFAIAFEVNDKDVLLTSFDLESK